MRNLFLSLMALSAAVAPVIPVAAQGAVAGPSSNSAASAPRAFDRATHYALLNQLKDKAEYLKIGEIIDKPSSQDEANANLDWLGIQFKTGASSYFSFQYSRLLSAYADAIPGNQGDQLRGTALAAMLHAIIASQAEAQQCADRTARADRPMRFMQMLNTMGLLEQNEEVRKMAGFIAFNMEQRTWDVRKQINDASFLCMNGMAAMSAGLTNSEPREVETPEGQIGRTFTVQPPADFVYERLPNEEWWPKAEELRAKNGAALKSLLNVDDLSFDPGN
ncbi:hypothetical protein [Alterisphingorhabdus coralli]|uniref:Uncharacterized protein n=1 Tax=Alterisphingorhabdus coralli TaxID=3071408 RepID=A0AA97F8T4_9SPHN|nr:hypothetical protein [Parasphingorhabdus sp. SCSIO 66989]WOE74590.1 hypothetical protein RB602_12140 [Parasphingorhabdus sp. SCSIO 66989]